MKRLCLGCDREFDIEDMVPIDEEDCRSAILKGIAAQHVYHMCDVCNNVESSYLAALDAAHERWESVHELDAAHEQWKCLREAEAESVETDAPQGLSDETKLVAALMDAGRQMTAGITDRLVDSLQKDNDRLRARLWLIESEIHRLAGSDTLRAPHMYTKALYPRDEAVTRVAENIVAKRIGGHG